MNTEKMCKSEFKMVRKNKQGWTCALRNLLNSLCAAHLAKKFRFEISEIFRVKWRDFFSIRSKLAISLVDLKTYWMAQEDNLNDKTGKTNFRDRHNETTLSLPQRDFAPAGGCGDESPCERGLVLSRTHFMAEKIIVVLINTQTKWQILNKITRGVSV